MVVQSEWASQSLSNECEVLFFY